jgi:acyl carrier protein
LNDSIESAVSAFLIDNFRFGDTSVAIVPDESLIEAGVIDSTGVLELVAFLEERFGLDVEDADIVPDNLDSLAAIARYVERKGGKAA